MYQKPSRWFDKILLPGSLKLALVSYVACVAIAHFATRLGYFDAAIPLVDGMLIQQGQTPNLDFYSFYPPLGLYMNAAAFGLFGRSVFAVRMINVMLYLWVLYLVTRFFSNRFANSRPLIPLAVLLVAASIGLTIAEPLVARFRNVDGSLTNVPRVDMWRTEPLFACRYRHLYRTSHVVADEFRRIRRYSCSG